MKKTSTHATRFWAAINTEEMKSRTPYCSQIPGITSRENNDQENQITRCYTPCSLLDAENSCWSLLCSCSLLSLPTNTRKTCILHQLSHCQREITQEENKKEKTRNISKSRTKCQCLSHPTTRPSPAPPARPKITPSICFAM